MSLERKEILLKAAFDILKKCNDAPFALSPMQETAFYDGMDCEGDCLLQDIADELGLDI